MLTLIQILILMSVLMFAPNVVAAATFLNINMSNTANVFVVMVRGILIFLLGGFQETKYHQDKQ